MTRENSQGFTIETIGLDELDIDLESPYGLESFQHALVVNNSPHNLIACNILFDFTRADGVVKSANKTVLFADLLEASEEARKRLLKVSPGIAPHSKMLVGLGVNPDLVRVYVELPPLGKADFIGTPNENAVPFKKLVVRIDAVVLEDGKAVGPGATNLLKQVQESLAKGQEQ